MLEELWNRPADEAAKTLNPADFDVAIQHPHLLRRTEMVHVEKSLRESTGAVGLWKLHYVRPLFQDKGDGYTLLRACRPTAGIDCPVHGSLNRNLQHMAVACIHSHLDVSRSDLLKRELSLLVESFMSSNAHVDGVELASAQICCSGSR